MGGACGTYGREEKCLRGLRWGKLKVRVGLENQAVDGGILKWLLKRYDGIFISIGWFLGVWILCADVSEHTVCSIFIGSVRRNNGCGKGTKMEQGVAEIRIPENHPKERIRYSEDGECLKSRIQRKVGTDWSGRDGESMLNLVLNRRVP